MDQSDQIEFERQVLLAVDHVEAELALDDGLSALPQPGDAPESQSDLTRTVQTAKSLVERRDIRAKLCPSLKSLADDSREIAKLVTAAMLPLALSGAIPLSPLIFAGIAVVIARTGIKTICPE